ncbi:hypothetical protein [Catenovulum sediminis]|uniref:Uncharacterized protein n=1 Tax=Catenovulum sediminis TaxID=1740262 RepID=A0ABV1RHV3_9ALTE|nr:hypothetical protein [Catenovulum sediminis]
MSSALEFNTHAKLSNFLFWAGGCSMLAALAHIAVIWGGPQWYRAFGAGEQLALMAEQGEIYPTLVTLFITSVLAVWGLYAYSGAKLIVRLPLLRSILLLITFVYCVRGIYGFFLPFVSDHPQVQSMSLTFWFVSSAICLFIGCLYLLGIRQNWQSLK